MRHVSILAACTILAGLAAPALAQLPSQVPFTCVGAGADQRERAANVPYTLKLVYAEPSGHFLADVTTRVIDGNGTVLLHLICGGPWLLLDLPAGTYQIESSFGGETKTQSVTVGQGRREQLVTF
ncbi:MAG: hypothetical protein ACFCVH_22190 [Alphaproteobacteria bacterium]